MNYCKHLKRRKNKPYCNILNKEISLSQCQECANKEYRIPDKGKMVKKSTLNKKSPLINGKCTKLSNKSAFQEKKSLKNTKIVQKSKKIAKLERNRYSVFTDDLKHCFLCGKKKEELHEIYAGRNRINSMKYGFVLPLCHECHSLNQNNPFFNEFWHKKAQQYFEEHYGTREDLIKIFRRNYLD